MWESVWTLLNSPAIVTGIAGIVLWLLNRLYARKPLWQQFEGVIIEAVRLAEKAVPDESENKAVRRFDEALKYVIKIYESIKGRRPTSSEVEQLKEGIRIVHNDLDVEGVL